MFMPVTFYSENATSCHLLYQSVSGLQEELSRLVLPQSAPSFTSRLLYILILLKGR